jgi:hypothetical protein
MSEFRKRRIRALEEITTSKCFTESDKIYYTSKLVFQDMTNDQGQIFSLFLFVLYVFGLLILSPHIVKRVLKQLDDNWCPSKHTYCNILLITRA